MNTLWRSTNNNEMAYKPMVVSQIIDVLVYTQNSGAPLTSSIGLKTCSWFTKILVEVYTPGYGLKIENVLVYTPVGASPVILCKVLHV